MWIDAALVALGCVALYFGAEWLVRGAARLAFALGVRPLVIGLTVVGFGTSMPEVVVSALASWRGQPDTALGNVVGSNIANPGLILGLTALIAPMKTNLALLKREGQVMVAVTMLFWALAWAFGAYTRLQGALMLTGLVAFTWLSLRWSRAETPAVEAEFEKFEEEQHLTAKRVRPFDIAWVVAGLVALIIGGNVLVTGAVGLARRFGIAEIIIATTLVAVGTSLPELATSIVAALRREADISVGNIVGSNIFNLLGVLGLASVIRPIPISAAARDFEFLWMVGFAAATALVLRTGHRITRAEGSLLLAAYVVFVLLLVR